MLTAPVFTPVKRKSRLKNSSSTPSCPTPPSDYSPDSTVERSRSQSKLGSQSSSLGIGSLSDDYDSETLSPTVPQRTSWKDDLDQWLEKRKEDDSNPTPVLGHEGMPQEERKQAIGNALKWLREEMLKMRQEDSQLKQDFTNLYSEVHMLKMSTLPRYRSSASISSLSDEDSDSMFDFPDSSMVGNMSTGSLMGRQRRHRAPTPSTPSSLHRRLLTPTRSHSNRKPHTTTSASHLLSSPQTHSTPVRGSSTIDLDTRRRAKMSRLAEEYEFPSIEVSKAMESYELSNSKASETDVRKHSESVENRTPPKESSDGGTPTASEKLNSDVVVGEDNDEPIQSIPVENSIPTQSATAAPSTGMSHTSHEMEASSVDQKRALTTSPPTSTPAAPVFSSAVSSTKVAASFANLERRGSTKSLVTDYTAVGYISPPNITQRSSPATSTNSSRAASLDHRTATQQYNQEVQKQQVLEAAANLALSSGGTLPRMHRKGHKLSSSSSSSSDLSATVPEEVVRTRQVHPALSQSPSPVRMMGNTCLHNEADTVQSSSMPSIRNAREDTPFSTRLLASSSNSGFSKYDSAPADQYAGSMGNGGSAAASRSLNNADVTQIMHPQPQAQSSPFFQPTSRALANLQAAQAYDETGFPSPLPEGTMKHFPQREQPSPKKSHPANEDYDQFQQAADYRYHHVRHHSADFSAGMQLRQRNDLASPLTSRYVEGSGFHHTSIDTSSLLHRQRLSSSGCNPQPAIHHGRNNSWSLPTSPRAFDLATVSVPSSPKVSRSKSDVQRNLAQTVALRCAQAAAAAPVSPALRTRSQTMFNFPGGEGSEVITSNYSSASLPRRKAKPRPSSMESLV